MNKFMSDVIKYFVPNNGRPVNKSEQTGHSSDELDIQSQQIKGKVPEILEMAIQRSESKVWFSGKNIDIVRLFEEESEDKKFANIKIIDIFANNSLSNKSESKRIDLRKQLLGSDYNNTNELPVFDLLKESEIDLILSHLNLPKLLMVANIWSQMKYKIKNYVSKQTFFWFASNTLNVRFFPLEDCCDLCEDETDIDKCCNSVIGIELRNAFIQLSDLMSKSKFTSVKCLRLFRFDINEGSDKWLAKMCPNLLHLDLTECIVSYSENLAKSHEKLNHLILGSIAINQMDLSALIKNKSSLKTFVANSTNITRNELLLLPKSTDRIDIRCCPRLESKDLLYFFKISNFTQLKYLRIDANFDDKGFQLLCSKFSDLILLELYDTEHRELFTKEGLKHISKLSKIRILKFGPNIAAQTIPLINIFEGCPHVISFSLDGMGCYPQIKEEDLNQIDNYWPQLQRLELKNIDCVGNQTIECLSRLPDLQHLDLTQCVNVDNHCLVRNLYKFSALKYLVLDKCHKLTELSLNAIKEKAENMDSIFNVSLFRSNALIHYIKPKEWPRNLRITMSSVKSTRFVTFDGKRAKYGKCRRIYQYFNGE